MGENADPHRDANDFAIRDADVWLAENSDENPNADGDPNADASVVGHPNAVANDYTYEYAVPNRDPVLSLVGPVHAHAHVDRDAKPKRNGHPHTQSITHRDGDRDASVLLVELVHADSHPDVDPHADADEYLQRNANRVRDAVGDRDLHGDA